MGNRGIPRNRTQITLIRLLITVMLVTLLLPVLPAGAVETLISQGKTATASSNQTGNVPANGNDGDLGTRWTAVNATYPQWWKVDLGASYDLTRVAVNWYLSGTRYFKYILEVSADDVTYSTVVDKSGNTTTGDTNDLFTATARYVRVTISGASTGWASFYDLQVYGEPTSGGDTTPPSAITNLAVGTTTSSSVQLTWTAPGDDGGTGTAASYDIRYSTSTITAGNWSSATAVTGEPTPAAAGTSQSMTVTGLSPSTTYYFAMKTNDEVPNTSALSNVPSGTTSSSGPVAQKLVLTQSMLLNEIAHENAGTLIDEQTVAGDPMNGTGGVPTTGWYLFGKKYGDEHPGESWWLPASAYLDLGQEYHITKVYFYDTNGSATNAFTVSTGTPFNWTPAFTDNLVGNNLWKNKDVNTDTRYLRFTFVNAGAIVREVVVYGYPIGTPDTPPTPTPHTKPVMEDLMGMNAFHDDPLSVQEVLKVVREYHNWDWETAATAYPSDTNNFAPSNIPGVNFDTFYTDMKNAGMTVSPAQKAKPAWLVSTDYNTPMTVPNGLSAIVPASYAARADHLFQFAARYGGTSVADGKLKLTAGQPRVSGLNLIDYIEDWNEPNGDWGARKAYWTPYEYAAMLSADYDGHVGTMGNTFGIKTADPSMKVVMGGLAGYRFDYLRAMEAWSKYNRSDGSFPADVLNFHMYCQNTAKTKGISPEDCNLKGMTKELVDYRDTYMPGKEVWVSEFGYDTHPSSPQGAPVIGTKTNVEVQADWLVRSYLALAASGIDRAMMYMLRDVDADNGKYSTSGLVGPKNDWTPKLSWYYVYTMRNTLTGNRYLGELSSGNPNVKVYKFKSATDNSGVYAVWAPTSNGTTVSGYSLPLSTSATSATLVTMAGGDTDGVSSGLTISSHAVTVNVSETPIFVKVNYMQ
ncbi:discoidin domain-containing protein [Paenibacillus koleovorans]|uniref:discoidin domain-containing protein n=1 Tax=Paenibacillus koleovorans TaxID=121608 RepID=UPI000FDB1A94|nr:discoidin domain-containing protein [Paenibacillus koleovorans]